MGNEAGEIAKVLPIPHCSRRLYSVPKVSCFDSCTLPLMDKVQ